MANLVNGLGGAAGFGEDSMARGNIPSQMVTIDLSSVFPNGLKIKGKIYSSVLLGSDGVTFPYTGILPTSFIAPFASGDVDTRFAPQEVSPSPGGTSQGSNLIYWDLDSSTGTFTVTWDDVSNLNVKNGKQNAFQLQIVAVGSEGDFDIHFRYETVQWLTDPLQTTDRPPGAYYSLGGSFFALPQSGTNAMASLPSQSNIGEAGHFVFEVRSPPLFTSGADMVDFNNLTADQKTAIASGEDKYHGLGGSDTIFLPSKANYQQLVDNGITLNWDNTIAFVAGDTAGQDYLITGGDGLDKIKLGNGDDTVFASPGNDEIQFGSGHNRFDYRNGPFAKFSGFAAGTKQTIAYNSAKSGGPPKAFQTSSAQQSTLELPGSPGDYEITVSLTNAGKSDFGKANMVVKTAGTVFTTPLTIDTFGIERVTYTDPKVGIKNTVALSGTQIGPGGSQGTLAAESMKLVDEVYHPGGFQTLQSDPLILESPSPRSAAAKARGWHLLQAAELGMAPADFGQRGTLVFTFIDGLYAAYDTGDRESEGSYSQANAFALVGMVNGKRTLSVDFRGTDQGLDFFNFFTFSAHYAKFAPLIDALRSYADNPDNGIEQVLVAGHSLGAGMTGYFLRDFAGPQYNLIAYTDGSPGFEHSSARRRCLVTQHQWSQRQSAG